MTTQANLILINATFSFSVLQFFSKVGAIDEIKSCTNLMHIVTKLKKMLGTGVVQLLHLIKIG